MSTYIIDSEPELSAPVDADEMLVHDASTNKTNKIGLDTLRSYMHSGVVNATAATLAVTAAEHAGRVVTLNRAAAQAVTLPVAAGTGHKYHFIVGTTVTSNETTIAVADASTIMTGGAWVMADGGNTVVAFETAGTSDTVELNGTTKGGIRGDSVELIDIAANLWYVRVMSSATGVEATPFDATVS